MTRPIHAFTQSLQLLLTAGLLLMLAPAAPAAAESCKGLSQSRCSASGVCTWVKGYVTKKGSEVKSYCRAKGGKGKQQASSASKGSKQTKAGEKTKLDSKSESKQRSSSGKGSKAKSKQSASSGKDSKKKKKSSDKKKKQKSKKTSSSQSAKEKSSKGGK